MVEAYFVQAVAPLLVNIRTGPGRDCASFILFVQLRRAASHCKHILSVVIDLQHVVYQTCIVNWRKVISDHPSSCSVRASSLPIRLMEALRLPQTQLAQSPYCRVGRQRNTRGRRL